MVGSLRLPNFCKYRRKDLIMVRNGLIIFNQYNYYRIIMMAGVTFTVAQRYVYKIYMSNIKLNQSKKTQSYKKRV